MDISIQLKGEKIITTIYAKPLDSPHLLSPSWNPNRVIGHGIWWERYPLTVS